MNSVFHLENIFLTQCIFLQTKENTALGKSEEKQPSYKSVEFTGIQNLSFIPEDEHQNEIIKSDYTNSDMKV
jgi:hypothetical protein